MLEAVYDADRHAPFGDLRTLHQAADDWRVRLEWLSDSIGWRGVRSCARPHPGGLTLAFTARFDVLFAATAMNEWAWRGAAIAAGAPLEEAALDPDALPLDPQEAVAKLQRAIAAEANPLLRALVQAARIRGVPVMVDEEEVSCGYGCRSLGWPATFVPPADTVNWDLTGEIPVALVTGSNGKTTTTRLIAAMLREAGHRVGYCCTDGVFIDGEQVAAGDWSGPAGAKRVLRDPYVTAAVLEVARGGLLRRGLVVPRAAVAVVTNIAADHFGEYGIHDVESLARVKLGVAAALGDRGTLVIDRDDPVLTQAADALAPKLAGRIETFSSSALPPAPLPSASEMPITADGAAHYNVANAVAAAQAAARLGVPIEAITATLRRFGSDPSDNPGRLMRAEVGGVRVIVDYAHNPHGLSALLGVVRTLADAANGARVLLLLGQAGNRDDEDIRELARVAWSAAPDLLIIKELGTYLRGRAPSEVPAILHDALRAAGAPEDRIETVLEESAAVRRAFAWARTGDLLVLPVHALETRETVLAFIASLARSGWRAGDEIPAAGA